MNRKARRAAKGSNYNALLASMLADSEGGFLKAGRVKQIVAEQEAVVARLRNGSMTRRDMLDLILAFHLSVIAVDMMMREESLSDNEDTEMYIRMIFNQYVSEGLNDVPQALMNIAERYDARGKYIAKGDELAQITGFIRDTAGIYPGIPVRVLVAAKADADRRVGGLMK